LVRAEADHTASGASEAAVFDKRFLADKVRELLAVGRLLRYLPKFALGHILGILISARTRSSCRSDEQASCGRTWVSEITAKVHRGNVMRKMGARSLADLVWMADTLGIRQAKH
jgi:hypothetical protein